jgi:uncharacterized protein (TIGR02452 family)
MKRFCEANRDTLPRAARVAHDPGFEWGSGSGSGSAAVDIRAVKMDTLDAAMNLGLRSPLVLIFADDMTPGGCVSGGAGMQEESLFRRTALCGVLTQDMYPIRADEALYAPSVPVLLRSEDGGYAPVPGPRVLVSFLACPGVKMPHLDAENRLRAHDRGALQAKVELILQTAATFGHRDLVLGALGCGVWGCPPACVASVFKETIQRVASRANFDTICFAVTGSNHAIFASAFAL